MESLSRRLQDAGNFIEREAKVLEEKVQKGEFKNLTGGVTVSRSYEVGYNSKDGLSLKGGASASVGTSTIGAGTAPRQAELARVSQQPSELLVVLDRLAWGSMIAVVGFGAYRIYTIIQANQNPVRERGLTPRSLVKSNEVIVASVVLIAGSVYFAGRWWQAADFTGILHPR